MTAYRTVDDWLFPVGRKHAQNKMTRCNFREARSRTYPQLNYMQRKIDAILTKEENRADLI